MNSNTRAGACGIQRSRAFTEQELQRIRLSKIANCDLECGPEIERGASSFSMNGTESGQGLRAIWPGGMAQSGAAPRGCVSVCHLPGVGACQGARRRRLPAQTLASRGGAPSRPGVPLGGTGKGGDKSAIHSAEMAADCQAPGALRFFKDGTDEFSCWGRALCGFLAFEAPDFQGQSAQLLQVLVQRPIMVRDEGAEFLDSAFDNTHPRMKAEAPAAEEQLGVSRLRAACGCAHTPGPASAPCAIQAGRAGRLRCCPL